MKPQNKVKNDILAGMIAEIEQMKQFYKEKIKRYEEQIKLFEAQEAVLEEMAELLEGK